MLSAALFLINFNRLYTGLITAFCLLLLLANWKLNRIDLRRFYPVFFLLILPFLLVNGILTGTFIDGEVVWYNAGENLGSRIFTIPVEDFFYAFFMILHQVMLFELFRRNSRWAEGGIA